MLVQSLCDFMLIAGCRMSLTSSILIVIISVSTLFASCGGKQETDNSPSVAVGRAALHEGDASERGKTMTRLLEDYGQEKGKRRVAAADKIFAFLFENELTENRLTATTHTPEDSVDMLVWHGASEYFWETQDYTLSMRYAKLALPLAYRMGGMEMQSDCEHLIGLNYFRLSDYANAVEYVRKSLAIDRKIGDRSRISSSLNTLAGICLTAKQFDDSEKYILEAIRHSTAAKDSSRMAIQYGMASEIYHAMNKEQLALDYAQKAYNMDAARGNTAKVGIRLSQMAAAQVALGQYDEGERSLMLAIPLLETAGNIQSLSICRNQMGDLLNRRGAFDEAAGYFRKAAEAFEARKDLYNESRARMGLYEALKENHPSEAGRHLLRYAMLKDSIYRRDMEHAVIQQNVIYKTEELALRREQERKEKRIILTGSIALMVALLIVLATLVYMGRVRRRNHLALKRLSKLRENFFTNITHEFRTPLTVILGLSHDLQNPGVTGVVDKAHTIERQGRGLLALINQLLDISKIESAVGNADWRNGDITVQLTMIVDSYRDFARNLNIDLHFFSKNAIEMDYVPDYVNKVMNNLLSNALKFTPEYGKVSVLAWRKGNQLCIDVADTGCGMDKETLTHVFEPFYQGERNIQNVGTGVGLALVKQIIDAVKGTITVESEVDKGTTFHISIPIHNDSHRQMAEVEETATPLLPETGATLIDSDCVDNQCRLLIIEDNRDIAAYIGSQFTDCHSVHYAANGKDGLDKALDLVPDLIITDLMMPGMDGLELCRQIRRNEIINHIPIIIVTAKITEEERIKGLEAGADAYIAKPFNSEELRTRVEKLLEGRRLLREKFAQAMSVHQASEDKDRTPSSDADARFLEKVSDAVFLLLNKNKSIDVSTIASKVCMSNSQFYRKIVALTGYAPSAYIQYIRIRQAKNLLDNNPTMSLTEVADRCGFDIYANFTRAFKQVVGVAPTKYRRE